MLTLSNLSDLADAQFIIPTALRFRTDIAFYVPDVINYLIVFRSFGVLHYMTIDKILNQPIFIIGAQRSVTTWVQKMLISHPEI